jgi:hypothetical protein
MIEVELRQLRAEAVSILPRLDRKTLRTALDFHVGMAEATKAEINKRQLTETK